MYCKLPRNDVIALYLEDEFHLLVTFVNSCYVIGWFLNTGCVLWIDFMEKLLKRHWNPVWRGLAFATHFKFVSFFSHISFWMSWQVFTLWKILIALFICVWLFSGMNFKMPCQVISSWKTPIAHFTYVWLFSSMSLHMPIQVCICCKTLFTHFTFIVFPYMKFEMSW